MDRPTAASDHSEFCNVIDRGTWESFAKLMNLPDQARGELGWVIAKEIREKSSGGRPAASRKRLKKLHEIVAKLDGGLADPAARGILLYSLQFGEGRARLPDRGEFALAEFQDMVRRWRGQLSRTLAGGRSGILGPGVPGNPTRLRQLIARLDRLLIRHTGRGFTRSSTSSKSRIGYAGKSSRANDGRARACAKFASDIVQTIFGRIPDGTIDDAMKDVIKHRRDRDRSHN